MIHGVGHYYCTETGKAVAGKRNVLMEDCLKKSSPYPDEGSGYGLRR